MLQLDELRDKQFLSSLYLWFSIPKGDPYIRLREVPIEKLESIKNDILRINSPSEKNNRKMGANFGLAEIDALLKSLSLEIYDSIKIIEQNLYSKKIKNVKFITDLPVEHIMMDKIL